MKLGLGRALAWFLRAVGLTRAIMPDIIREARIVARRDLERASDRLTRQHEKSLARHAKRADKILAAGLRDIQKQIRACNDRLGTLERKLKAGQRQQARFERQAETGQLRMARFEAACNDRLGTLERKLKAGQQQQAHFEALLDQDDRPDPEVFAQLDLKRIGDHVECRLDAVSISTQPFAHIIVDELLPADFYELLVDAIPPAPFFALEKKSKHDFRPNARLAPQRTKVVWGFLDQQVCSRALMPILLERFAPLLDAHLRTLFGEAALDQARALPMTTFDGRIMRRRPGYHLGPHQDPMRYFLTGIIYLPGSPDEDVRWGTQLFTTDQDYSVPFDSIFYPESHGVQCSLAKTTPYRRNSLLMFLNHRSLHGAEIPPEAPEDLERFSFQFYIGPETAALKALVRSLPDERRNAWHSRRDARLFVDAG